MRAAVIGLFLVLSASAGAVGFKQLHGTWEAARSPEGERLYVRLLRDGTAEIVAEFDIHPPGQPGIRRGRSTTFGKWAVKQGDVVLTYGKVRDRLRFSATLSLVDVGLKGAAPGLEPVGKPDPNSRLGGAILWKAPHDYQRMAGPPPPSERDMPAAPPAD